MYGDIQGSLLATCSSFIEAESGNDRVDRFFLMTRHKAPLWPFGLKLNRFPRENVSDSHAHDDP